MADYQQRVRDLMLDWEAFRQDSTLYAEDSTGCLAGILPIPSADSR